MSSFNLVRLAALRIQSKPLLSHQNNEIAQSTTKALIHVQSSAFSSWFGNVEGGGTYRPMMIRFIVHSFNVMSDEAFFANENSWANIKQTFVYARGDPEDSGMNEERAGDIIKHDFSNRYE